jgi:hypothetical protein
VISMGPRAEPCQHKRPACGIAARAANARARTADLTRRAPSDHDWCGWCTTPQKLGLCRLHVQRSSGDRLQSPSARAQAMSFRCRTSHRERSRRAPRSRCAQRRRVAPCSNP